MEPGTFQTLRCVRDSEHGFYLSDGENDVLLPRKYSPQNFKIGDELEVFIATDSEDRLVATTRTPKGVVGDVVKLTCVSANHLGAFLAWGLDKDLFVPFRNQSEPMRANQEYVVVILLDRRSGRLVGSNRFDRILKAAPHDLKSGDEVRILPFRTTPLGTSAIVGGKYLGILYASEMFEKIELGVKRTAFVSKIREDGRIDLALRRPGRAGVMEEKQKILDALHSAGGTLPYGVKTPPRSIERAFHMSKRTFKEILGSLYKERLVTLEPEQITLVPNESEKK